MASTYSSYKIELIGTGEQSGTWGNTTNNNFQYAIEQAIGGYATQVLTTTSTSLTLSDTNALQNARALFLQFTGTPGSGATVVLPSIQKLYFIKNAITTYDLIVKTSTAATITVPNGKTACIYVNGTDVVGTEDWLPSLTTTSATISGNFSSGTVTTTSGTYSRSGTTVTITSAAHGFSTGQNLYLVFTTGAATTGVYSITVVDANTFTVTDSVSGTTSGNVTINRYTNTVTFLAPVSSFGSFGTAGQVLASQGVNIPPKWTTLSTNSISQGDSNVTVTDAGSGIITFTTDNTEKARISSAGDFGLGTNNPKAKEHIVGNGQLVSALTDAGDRGDMLRISGTSTSAGSGGAILFSNSQADTANSVGFAAIKGLLISGSGNTTGSIAISTRTTSSDVALTQRVLIDSTAMSVTGEIRATNNITAYFSSDKRLKENIRPIQNSLDKVSQISGVTYDWTQEYIEAHGGEDGFFVRKNDVGLIAQEVEKILPEIVVDNQDGYKAIKYERVVALLVEAIKELKAEVEKLKNER